MLHLPIKIRILWTSGILQEQNQGCKPQCLSSMTRKPFYRYDKGQLRSGHCKPLNSYKKRLKQSDSSNCPDCRMDPQDVPHLFDCTAHPNDLSSANLWDNPVEMIRELSFMDPGNLDYQMSMVEEGIQQQPTVA